MEIEIEKDNECLTTVEFGECIILRHYDIGINKTYPFVKFLISQQAFEKAIAEWKKFKEEAI